MNLTAILLGLAASISGSERLDRSESWCPGLVTKPEPRRESYDIKWAAELAREVREADAGKGLELVFYGDSITEQWRGTDQGGTTPRAIGDSAIFDKYFGSKYRSLVLAVGGDQVGHLQWRLLHGDIPKLHQPKAAVIMIGTNDLGAVSGCSKGDPKEIYRSAEGVKARINETMSLLREKLPDTQLLMLGILPRGSGTSALTTYTWPGIYTPAINNVNAWLEEVAQRETHIHYLNCGPFLLYNGKILPTIMADGLHPTPIGMLSLAKCISPMLDQIIKDADPQASDSMPQGASVSFSAQ